MLMFRTPLIMLVIVSIVPLLFSNMFMTLTMIRHYCAQAQQTTHPGTVQQTSKVQIT